MGTWRTAGLASRGRRLLSAAVAIVLGVAFLAASLALLTTAQRGMEDAVAAVEAFLGSQPLNPDIIVEGLGAVEAPARLEQVRTSPPILLDTAHNPPAARATIDALAEAYSFDPLVGVVAMMQDKDADEVLTIFAEQMQHVVVTTVSSTTRGRSVEDLAAVAESVFPPQQVHRAPGMAEALDIAVMLADTLGMNGGVLVAGSVIAAGEARDLLTARGDE